MGESLLAEARALRAAYPDMVAVRSVPRATAACVHAHCYAPAVRQALAFLRDEMERLRGGRVEGLWVLDDEIAHTEAVLAGR